MTWAEAQKAISDKNREIERLLTKHEKEKNLLLTVLDKQTTEIDRLKGESAIKESTIRDLCAIARDKNLIITELADALDIWSQHQAASLIQRAREAAR